MKLRSFTSYGLGNTPMYWPTAYCTSGNLCLKIESHNPNGSIKDRTAYFIIKDLLDEGKLDTRTRLVESSSGNLGLALAFFANQLDVQFICLIDPTLPIAKVEQLAAAGVKTKTVSLDNRPDYRTARIELARELDQKRDWIWTNQYDNPSNLKAHFETTGPEIWGQTNGNIDYVVCPVGTGGTICGIGHYIKKQNPSVKIVGVEPLGSTIFGGNPGPYLSEGTGMRGPSGIIRRYGQIIDYYCQVADDDSLKECVQLRQLENLYMGVSTGSALAVARYLASIHPSKIVVVVAPDGGEQYSELFIDLDASGTETQDYALRSPSWPKSLSVPPVDYE